MVCRGGPWKVPWKVPWNVPWYAVEGFAAGRATACHDMYVAKKDKNVGNTPRTKHNTSRQDGCDPNKVAP